MHFVKTTQGTKREENHHIVNTSRKTDCLTLGIHSTFTSAQLFGASLTSAYWHLTGTRYAGPRPRFCRLIATDCHPSHSLGEEAYRRGPFPFCTRGLAARWPRRAPLGALRVETPQPRSYTAVNANQNRYLSCAAEAQVQKASLSLPRCYIVFAAENGRLSVCNSERGQTRSARFCSTTPSLPDNLVHPREVSNLLWFSKSCARQLQRLPFSREALRRVVLRNPHLRLICRTKKKTPSFRKLSCQTRSGSCARPEGEAVAAAAALLSAPSVPFA